MFMKVLFYNVKTKTFLLKLSNNNNKEDLKLCIVEHLEKGRGPLVATLRAVLDECLKLRPISFDEFDFFAEILVLLHMYGIRIRNEGYIYF